MSSLDLPAMTAMTSLNSSSCTKARPWQHGRDMTAAFTSLSKSSTEPEVKNAIQVLKQFVVIMYDTAIAGESVGTARKVLSAQQGRMLDDVLQQAMRYTLSFVFESVFVCVTHTVISWERGCL